MSMKNFSPEVTPKKSNGLLDNVKGSGKEVNLYVHDCMPLYFLFMKIFFQASWDIPKTSFSFETLPGHGRNCSQQILNLLHFSPQDIYHLLYYKRVCTVDFFSSNAPEVCQLALQSSIMTQA